MIPHLPKLTSDIQSNTQNINVPIPLTQDDEFIDWEKIIIKKPNSPLDFQTKINEITKNPVIMNKYTLSNEQLKKEIINIKIKNNVLFRELKKKSIDIINLGLFVGTGFLGITFYLGFLTYKMYDPFSKRCSLL